MKKRKSGLYTTSSILVVAAMTALLGLFILMAWLLPSCVSSPVMASEAPSEPVEGKIKVEPPLETRPVIQPIAPVEVVYPNNRHVILQSRLAEGIYRYKTGNRRGWIWFECGEALEGDAAKERAEFWAKKIVHTAYGSKVFSETNVSAWGIAGIIAHESGFDRCAIGPHPRNWAIDKGIIKRKRNTISYSRDDILHVIKATEKHKKFRYTGLDLGPCQVLSRYYRGNTGDLMDIDIGLKVCQRHMYGISKRRRTRTPWRWWPGKESPHYDVKIRKMAHMLGAKRGEV